jgi:hypothetical protein
MIRLNCNTIDLDCNTIRAHAPQDYPVHLPGEALATGPELLVLDPPRSNLRHARASDGDICQDDTTEANGPPERSRSTAITTTPTLRLRVGLAESSDP